MTKTEELEQMLNEWLKATSKEEMIKILEQSGFQVIDLKKDIPKKPLVGTNYHFLDCYGIYKCVPWTGSNTDEWRYENIPIFSTFDKCREYWLFKEMLKEKSYLFSTDEWNDSTKDKYYIYYDFDECAFFVGSADSCKSLGEIYFPTRESAQYVIDNFEDELLEYGVKGGLL